MAAAVLSFEALLDQLQLSGSCSAESDDGSLETFTTPSPDTKTDYGDLGQVGADQDLISDTNTEQVNENYLPTPPLSPSSETTTPEPTMVVPSNTILWETDLIRAEMTEHAGMGIFAKVDLNQGEMIHSETPLLHVEPHQLFESYQQLTEEERAEFHSLHAHHLSSSISDVVARYQTNRFRTFGKMTGVFAKASRFNHACMNKRNVDFKYNQVEGAMTFTMVCDVAADTELKICYGGTTDRMFWCYGFTCRCGGCDHVLSDDEITRMKEALWQ